MRSPGELSASFRERGLRITPQRVAVFEALHECTGHPTAEAIYQTVVVDQPSISLKTVYQTLNDLTEMGEIRRLELGSSPTRFDPNIDDHHHLLCDDCGVMIDTYLDVSGLELESIDGFEPTNAHVFVSGRCASCAAAATTT